MNVLLDTNVILDVMLEREQWFANADAIWRAAVDQHVQCFVTSSSLTDIYYISRKLVGRDNARHVIRECLDNLIVLAVGRPQLESAYASIMTDFEDALQVVCAEHQPLDALITRYKSGLGSATVLIMSPGELVARLRTSD